MIHAPTEHIIRMSGERSIDELDVMMLVINMSYIIHI